MSKNDIETQINENFLRLVEDCSPDVSKIIEDAILLYNNSKNKNNINTELLNELEKLLFELVDTIQNKSEEVIIGKNFSKNSKKTFTVKSTIMIVVLSLLAAGSAIALGMEFKKAEGQNISSTTNTMVSTALTIESVSVSAELDDSSIAAISEDGLTFIWGIQANNGDIIDAQITLKNNANTEIVALIKADKIDGIEILFSGTNVGKISENEWLVSVPGGSGGSPGYKTYTQSLEIDPKAEPGFYQFSTYIESTSLRGLNTT